LTGQGNDQEEKVGDIRGTRREKTKGTGKAVNEGVGEEGPPPGEENLQK